MPDCALIVDDDGSWRDILARAVERVGLQQESASTTDRALDLIRRRSHGLVLLDADLGTELGRQGCAEILAELKSKGSAAPAIIVSGAVDLSTIVQELQTHYSKIGSFRKGDSVFVLEGLIRTHTGIPAGISSDWVAAHSSNLVEHVEYVFAFLRMDIVGHSSFYESNRGTDIDVTLNEFEEFVEEHILAHTGEILSWAGDGGLVSFVTREKARDCVEAGLSILEDLSKFNRSEMNKLGRDIELRLAAHIGPARYRRNHGRIHSASINFVSHLEAEKTKKNSLCISRPILREIPPSIRRRFHRVGSYCGLAVYETYAR